MPSGSRKYILIVSQYYYPDVTAAAFRIKETADILSAMGHHVSVIGAEPHRGEAEGRQNIDDGKVHAVRVPIIKYSGKGKWNYILHYLSFMFNAIVHSITLPEPPEIVIASSPPLFVGMAGYIISLFKNAHFVLDVRDIWPDSAVVAGQIAKNGFLYKAAKIIELGLYKRARLISCVAEPMSDYISRNSHGKKPLIVYNGIPEKYLTPNLESRAKIMPLLPAGKLNVVYVGNMGFCQNIGMVLDSARSLQDQNIDDVSFILVGGGVERPRLEEKAAGLGLRNVVFAGPIGKDEAIELVRNSSALFLQLKDDGIMEKTIPSKVFDYMLGGKPILFGIKGEGERILSGIKGNIAFQPDSPDSFTEAVKKLRGNYSWYSENAVENISYVRENFVRENLVRKLEERIIQLS